MRSSSKITGALLRLTGQR